MNNHNFYNDEIIINLYHNGKISEQKIIMYFYKKYLSRFRSISYYYFSKFYSLPIEVDDLMNLCYETILECIEKKRLYKNITIIQLLIRTYRFKVLDYLRKYTSNKYKTLNKAKYIDEVILNKIRSEDEPVKRQVYDLLLKEYIFGKFFKNNITDKKIFKMRLEGYSYKEISKKLKITSKTVDNSLSKTRQKFKSLSL